MPAPTTSTHPGVFDLPAPDQAAAALHAELAGRIRAAIKVAGGVIGFDEYMRLALYAPGLGYYSAGSRKFGEAGDFVTAPEISLLFSACLARQCAQVLDHIGGGELLEFGAGSGVMAADLLNALAASGCPPERYFIVELSADLRQRQRETLAARAPSWLERVVWLDTLPQPGAFKGVILANEVLDAMPVKLFHLRAGQIFERGVALAEEDGSMDFSWRDTALTQGALYERARRLSAEQALPDDYLSEVNLEGEAWLRSLADMLGAGAILLIDYGYPRHEYYHAQRDQGTLQCHYRHRAHAEPLILAGLQDITAHVDFTAMAEAADEAGLEVAGFTTQAHFLMSLGIESLLATGDETGTDERARLAQNQQLRKLLMPQEMGELFKVLALTRGVTTALAGFALSDQRHRL